MGIKSSVIVLDNNLDKPMQVNLKMKKISKLKEYPKRKESTSYLSSVNLNSKKPALYTPLVDSNNRNYKRSSYNKVSYSNYNSASWANSQNQDYKRTYTSLSKASHLQNQFFQEPRLWEQEREKFKLTAAPVQKKQSDLKR